MRIITIEIQKTVSTAMLILHRAAIRIYVFTAVADDDDSEGAKDC